MDDLISRQAAIELVEDLETMRLKGELGLLYAPMIKGLRALPPAQPDLDEWCTDCKEYDQERHCCPRWNRVIRETLKDAQPEPRWIPVNERLPEDERYVLVTTVSGNVTEAKYWQKEGFWVLRGLAISSVTAWMPLPKPYERSEE